jgi:DNA polymerase-3 subunit chi
MTRVDFYILPEGANDGAVPMACKLCDKAAAAGKRVYVHAPEAVTVEELDSVLWSFRQGGFIAHERYLGRPLEEPLPAVAIGSGEPPETHHEVLINLGLEVPVFFSRFERVLELVAGDAAQRARSRERYKFYRDRGYPLETHDLRKPGG